MPSARGSSEVGTWRATTADARRAAERAEPAATASAPFDLNARVRHVSFGEGTVQHYDDGGMTILFDDAGYKTFDLAHAVEQELVKPVAG